MATEFVTAIKTSEIPAGGITAIDVRGMRVAVANVAGTYYAFDDACTHEQCSLAEEGELAVPVKVYPVRIAGDALQIEV